MPDPNARSDEPCPQGRTDYEACFAPFRYCPEKGCGRAEGGVQLPTETTTEAAPLRGDDLIRTLLDLCEKRVASAKEKRFPFDPGTWPMPHRHYNDVAECGECHAPLDMGTLEIAQEAEYVQQLMDFIGVPDGLEQGGGDADWRVAKAVIELMDARERLSRISLNHSQEQGDGGMVGSYCVECGHVWPCPTYRFAHGDADPLDSWTGTDA